MANEGPSLTKATYDRKRNQTPAPSPERRKAALEQSARDSADLKLFRTKPRAWLAKHKKGD
jgi:hypothetical protein